MKILNDFVMVLTIVLMFVTGWLFLALTSGV